MSNSPPDPSDPEKYIIGIRNNNRPIMDEVYTRFLPSTIDWIKNNSGSEEDACDIFQESLMVIVRKVFDDPSFLPTSPFGAYLFGITRLLWLKKLKTNKKKAEKVRNVEWEEYIGKEAFEAMIEMTLDGDRWLAVLDRSFNQLTKRCQKLLTSYREGKKASEIAEQFDRNINAVYRGKNDCAEKWRTYAKQDSDYKKYNPY